MAPLRTLLPALGLWLLQVRQTNARAQGFTGAEHPFMSEPVYDPVFSFGHQHPISHDHQHVPNYEILGNPEILSDRIILTPPHRGHERSALWSDHSNHNDDWEIHVPFRATGPERAGGSLQIWYTFRGSSGTGTSTIYTAKPFEGLAFVIDSFGGQGTLRAFLNDGTTDYSIHHHPTSLAFGQCNVAYRNLGRTTEIKIAYTKAQGLKVEFDNHLCFETDKVQIPGKYRFGISAASAENPDSFEIFGFKVAVKNPNEEYHYQNAHEWEHEHEHHQDDQKSHTEKQKQRGEEEKQKRHKEASEHHEKMSKNRQHEFHSQFEYKDEEAKSFKSTEAQFGDLHLRMQALTHQIAEVQRVTGEISYGVDHVMEQINNLAGGGDEHKQQHTFTLQNIEDRLHSLEQTILNLERSLRHEGEKITQLTDHHENLPNHLKEAITEHGPRMGFSISLLIVFQVMLAIAYVVYKRRRSLAPKKYL
ncbi:hypothetical protein ABW20_dc0100656 [Dactylellina cionopaga]|nr:hypothetical protein ABW20_dc0100656 [Dactylellina cionopaga]